MALYDPSQPSPDGSFWSWRAPGLDPVLLDRFFYEVAAPSRPTDASSLDRATVIGGLAQLSPDWTCAYRFGDGGRDARGRPGRLVVLAAVVARAQASGVDLAPLLTCELVQAVLARAPTARPVPAPDPLEVEFNARAVSADPAVIADALRTGRTVLQGPTALARAGALCAQLPADRCWTCRISVNPAGGSALVECPSAPTETSRRAAASAIPGDRAESNARPARARTGPAVERLRRWWRDRPPLRAWIARAAVLSAVAVLMMLVVLAILAARRRDLGIGNGNVVPPTTSSLYGPGGN